MLVLVFGAISLILWVGGHDVLAGEISAGQLSAFVFYAALVAGAVGALSEVWGDLQRAAGATERLLELLAAQPEVSAPPQPVPLPARPRGALAFEDVSFRYPSRPDTPALADFSLAVAPGESVALVGPSGAGKTTVFQLLLRFYDPQAGSVRLDGVDVVAPPTRRRCAAHRPGAAGTGDLRRQRAGQRALWAPRGQRRGRARRLRGRLCGRVRAPLPQGFDTVLGERGVRLSGGQRQRIAIARALLADRPILLLDEATSALDAESERLVQAALERLMKDRTTLVIAHRLATVQHADRIVVMDGGRIVETGTHAELVRQDGLYAHLAQLQFPS